MIDVAAAAFLVLGAFFYVAGTVGLLRFPDVYCRLHALAKADNLGLGCVASGLALQADDVTSALKVLLVWPLTLAASAAVSYSIARRAAILATPTWRNPHP